MRTLAILLLLCSTASAVEVPRKRVYESDYRPYTIVALLVDGAIDAYQAGGIGDGIEIDFDSIEFAMTWNPWRIEYSYDVKVGGVFAHKRTIATAVHVWQSAYVTGDIGELSSAYWTSDAVRTDTGTRITNTLSVEWHAQCGLLDRLITRAAERRYRRNRDGKPTRPGLVASTIAPLVDRGLATIETKVRDFTHGGQLWPVLEELRGGLR